MSKSKKTVACDVNDLVLYQYWESVFIGRVLWKGDYGAVLVEFTWLPRVVSADDVLACGDKGKLIVLRDEVKKELAKYRTARDKARNALQQMLLNTDPDIIRKIYKKTCRRAK